MSCFLNTPRLYNPRMGKTRKEIYDPEGQATREALKDWARIPAKKRKFRAYFDADIPATVAKQVREKLKWDVLSVQETPDLQRQEDKFHYSNAKKLRRVFFTLDQQFLNDALFPLHQSPGVYVLHAPQNAASEIYSCIELASIHLKEAYNKVPDFVNMAKVSISLEGQRIRFRANDGEIVEVVASWFPGRRKKKF